MCLQPYFIGTPLQLIWEQKIVGFFFLSSLHVKHVTLFFQRLKFEIAEVMTEIEQLTCIGER